MKAQELIERWIRPEIRALHAYHVPDATGMVKLDAMENPYTWPPELVDEWLAELRRAPLNRYPDPEARALRERLRAAMAVPPGMDVLLGNGSDELIQLLALGVAGPGRSLLAPEPSFVMYRMIASFTGMDFVPVPLRADFSLDLPAMLDAIEREEPALVFLAYPNNPTGNLFAEAELRAIIEASPGLVIVDEAYAAFAERSCMSWLADYPNLLVMRTLSKMGLAGLRLGLLAGRPEWLAELNKLRLPYNINVLTQLSADFALRHRAVLDRQTEQIVRDRAALLAELARLPGITAYPSQANFILFRVAPGRAEAVFAALKQAGVLIKNLNGAGGLLRDCLRVTVGTPEENRAFVAALAAAA